MGVKSMAVLAAVLVGVAPSATFASTTPPDADDNTHVYTLGDVAIPPGEPGVISIVLVGPPTDLGQLPVVVRNNTAEAVGSVEVNVIARDSAGGLVATGSDSGFWPAPLQPGQWAFGLLTFDAYRLAGGEQFEFTTASRGVEYALGNAYTVVEAAIQPGTGGETRVIGILQNDSDETSGMGRLLIACFEGPLLTGIIDTFPDSIGPGSTGGFTATAEGVPCFCRSHRGQLHLR